MTVWMMLLPVVVTALGVALLVRGVRGRRVDDHPICRRCGFDLFGRPQDSDRCPECGADLAAPKAIRLGRRERRRWALAGGVGLIAMTLSAIGTIAWLASGGFDFNPYKPTAWLVRETMDPPTSAAAAAELVKRLAAHKVSYTRVAAMADRLLAFQGDPNRTWLPGVGDVIEQAQASGQLSAERWKRYVVQAPRWKLVVRPKISRGDNMPCMLDVSPGRIASRSRLVGAAMVGRWEIGGQSYPLIAHSSFDPFAASGATFWTIPLPHNLGNVTDGPQTLIMTLELAGAIRSSPRSGVPVVNTISVSAPFELLAADRSSVAERRDPSLRAAIEQALRVKSLRSFTPQSDFFGIELQIRPVPVGVAFEVFVRCQGRPPVRAGAFKAPPLEQRSTVLGCQLRGFTGDRFDLILKPNPHVAVDTLNVMEAWVGDEIVLHDVVIPGRSTTRPAP